MLLRILNYLYWSVLAGLGGLVGYLLVSTTDLPVVNVSHTTGECVSVVSSGGYDCINLPEKYIHVWVK